jgi:hypothetical protein
MPPTIPLDILLNEYDIDALCHHIPSHLLPLNWSCDWTKYGGYADFTANIHDKQTTHIRMYDIGNLEFRLRS